MCFRPLTAATIRREYQVYKQVTKDLPWDDWEKENFLMELPDKWQLSFASYVGEVVAGYVIASRKDECTAHIHRFMVHPDCRAQGIGSALLHHFDKHVPPEIRLISLAVAEENFRATAFYLREGFQKIEKSIVDGESYNLLRKDIVRGV